MDCTFIYELQDSKVCPTTNLCKIKKKNFADKCSGKLGVTIEDSVECLKTQRIRNTILVFCSIAVSDL